MVGCLVVGCRLLVVGCLLLVVGWLVVGWLVVCWLFGCLACWLVAWLLLFVGCRSVVVVVVVGWVLGEGTRKEYLVPAPFCS